MRDFPVGYVVFIEIDVVKVEVQVDGQNRWGKTQAASVTGEIGWSEAIRVDAVECLLLAVTRTQPP
jgi:hypothetical protein